MAKIESLSEIEDYKKEKERESRIKRIPKVFVILFVILLSITIGFVVYKITDKIINKDKPVSKTEFIGESIPLSDENVQILYDYVTYGTDGRRNTKFVTNRSVDLSSFTLKEKYYYAFQFVQVDDFEFTGEVDEQNNKIYVLSNNIIKKYMRLYFGDKVTFEPEEYMEYPFSFTINKMNVGKMTYNVERNGYDTIFDSYEDIENKPETVYGQLISALRQPDGFIVLQERVVYTETKNDNAIWTLNVYKDPEHTVLLDAIGNLSESDLIDYKIDFKKYSSTAIVEYTFGWNGQMCYFSNSRIIL